MTKADQMLAEMKRIVAELEKLGNEFVSHFPESSSLYEFTSEVDAAYEGMAALLEKFEEAVQVAKNEMKLKQNILQQMNDEAPYAFISEIQRDKLAEYLVQQNVGLAGTEQLMQFIVKSIQEMTTAQIVKSLSKEFVTRMGSDRPAEEGKEFDAYASGMAEVERILEDPEEKDQFIAILAKEYMKRNPDLAVKKFYSKVGL